MTTRLRSYLPIFLASGLMWAGILWGLSVAAQAVTVRDMLKNASYWPPVCVASPCVLTGLGGIVGVWERYVDRNAALGRRFVVRGVCASACEIAARRAHAEVLPGALLIPHKQSPTMWG